MLQVVGAHGRRLACGVLLAVCVLAPVASQVSRDGWVQAQSDRALEFPRDHWSHPDYRIEWWYYTGNLEGERGQRRGARFPSAARTRRTSMNNYATSNINEHQ